MAQRSKCPNIHHPEFKKLQQLLPGQEYTIWDANDGGLEVAPNGEPSLLWNRLLEIFNNDEQLAANAKAKIYTTEYQRMAEDTRVNLDVNGEPILTETPEGWIHVNGYTIARIQPENSVIEGIRESINQARTEALTEEGRAKSVSERDRIALDKYTKTRAHLIDELNRADTQEAMSALAQDAAKTARMINEGMKTRIKALRQYVTKQATGTKVFDKVQMLEKELREYEALYEQAEDQQVALKFLQNIAKETADNRARIEKNYNEYMKTNKFSMRTEQLVQLKTDFLGFYQPLLKHLHVHLYSGGYFDNLTTVQKKDIREAIINASTSFDEMAGMYSKLMLNRMSEILKEYGDTHNSATIDAYLAEGGLNSTEADITLYHRIAGSLRNVDDEVLRIIHSMIVENNNKVEEESFKGLAKFVQLGSQVKDQQQFYEKDSKGVYTGKLIRDLNFGQWENEKDEFMKTIGVDPPIDRQALKEWRKAINDWHAEHTERRYTPEYYSLFNNLSQAATMARDEVSMDISRLLQTVMDKDGNINLENMSDEDYARLETLYIIKKSLGVKFNFDGSTKSGIDFDVAEELSVLNQELSKNLDYKVNQAKFDAAMDEKRRTLSPEKFKKWYDRNTRLAYTEQFNALLDKMGKTYYDETYESINKDRREFLSLFRTNKSMQVDAARMSNAAKAKVREMDRALQDIRNRMSPTRTGKADMKFSEIAEIVPTDRYRRDKQAAIERDKVNPGAYTEWRLENHYFDRNGTMHPYSYYTYMKPVKEEHLARIPSNEFSEMDINSPFVNSNFDESYGSKYVPKRSLYDNKKAYDKVMSKKINKDYYDAIVNIINETRQNAKLDNLDNYTLPQISGTMYAFTKAGDGWARGIRNYFADKVEMRDDDIEYKPSSQMYKRPDGSPLRTIPKHYVQKLPQPGSISRDLIGILMQYYKMGVNYKVKSQNMPIYELIQQLVDERSFAPKERVEVFGAGALKEREVAATNFVGGIFGKGAYRSNMSARLTTLLQSQVYGEKKDPLTMPIGKGRRLNVNKILSHFRNYSTIVKLGLSPFVWAKNFVTSLHQNFIEASGGKHYNRTHSRKASYEISKQYLQIVTQWGDFSASNKLMAMMNANRVVRSVDESFNRLNYNRVARFAMNHLWFGGMTAGDYMIKSHNMVAVHMAHKYIPGVGFMTENEYIQKVFADRTKDMTAKEKQAAWNTGVIDKEAKRAYRALSTISLYDIYEADGIALKVKDEYKDLEKYLTDSFKNKITNTIHYLNERADGQLSQEDKSEMHRNVLASFTIMLRNYLLQAIDDRILQKRQWNYLTQDWDEGMYRSAFRSLIRSIRYGADLAKYHVIPGTDKAKPEWNRLDATDSYYLRRVATDLFLQIAYKLVLALIIRGIWEKDPYDWKKSALMLLGVQSGREIQNLYDPVDIFKSLQSVTPATDEIDNALEAFVYLVTDPDREVLYGAYKGWPKWAQKGFKLTPFKNLYEAQDPNAKVKYITTQLKSESLLEGFIEKTFKPKPKQQSFKDFDFSKIQIDPKEREKMQEDIKKMKTEMDKMEFDFSK